MNEREGGEWKQKMKSTLFSIVQSECDLTLTAAELDMCCTVESRQSISAGSNCVLYCISKLRHFLLILSFQFQKDASNILCFLRY